MKLFKKYKTKRQLRKENSELRAMLNATQNLKIHATGYEVLKVISYVEFDSEPIEIVKEKAVDEIMESLKEFVEWDLEDDRTQLHQKCMCGSLYIAKKK